MIRRHRRNPASVPDDLFDPGEPDPYPYPFEDPSLSPEEKNRRWELIKQAGELRLKSRYDRSAKARTAYKEIVAEILRQIDVSWTSLERDDLIDPPRSPPDRVKLFKVLKRVTRDALAGAFGALVSDHDLFDPRMTISPMFGAGKGAPSEGLRATRDRFEAVAVMYDRWWDAVIRYVQRPDVGWRSEPSDDDRKIARDAYDEAKKIIDQNRARYSQHGSAIPYFSFSDILYQAGTLAGLSSTKFLEEALHRAFGTSPQVLERYVREAESLAAKGPKFDRKAAKIEQLHQEAMERGEERYPDEIITPDGYRWTVEFKKNGEPWFYDQQRAPKLAAKPWKAPYQKIYLTTRSNHRFDDTTRQRLMILYDREGADQIQALYYGALQRRGVPIPRENPRRRRRR